MAFFREPEPDASAEERSFRCALWPRLILVGLFTLAVWPHILLGNAHSEGDEKYHYYPTVLALAADWPRVSPYDVPQMSAAGPLCLYLLAALPAPVVQNVTALKLASSLLSLALVLVIYHYVHAACRDQWLAFTLTPPIVCCVSTQCHLATHRLGSTALPHCRHNSHRQRLAMT